MSTTDYSTQTRAFFPLLESLDVDASVAFYKGLGYTDNGTMAGPDGKAVHSMITSPCGRITVMITLNTEFQRPARGMSLYVMAPEGSTVDEAHAKISAAGAPIVAPLEDQFWGDRTFTFADPDGHCWTIAQRTDKTAFPEGVTMREPVLG